LLAALWIYGLAVGMETAAGIAEACRRRDDFKWLAGGQRMCAQTLLNFLTRATSGLTSIWVQVLRAMHQAGMIDLSVIAEDGTKLRANASPRSFRRMDKIDAVIKQLRSRLNEIADRPVEQTRRKAAAELAGLRARLGRAEKAREILEERVRRRKTRRKGPGSDLGKDRKPRRARSALFGREDFRLDPLGEALICPNEEKLRYIGTYSDGEGQRSYRLYRRRHCLDCPLKDRCTRASGRSVKITFGDKPVRATSTPTPPNEPKGKEDSSHKNHSKEPTASLTEPEAAWMLATSRKRWEPSFNADIAVTRDGVIVSQFLTNVNNDFHHFEPTLDFVKTTLGTPEKWLGDGHYGTEENIVLASEGGVLLYAPRLGRRESEPRTRASRSEGGTGTPRNPQGTGRGGRYGFAAFEHPPARDILICPAGQELRYIGEYEKEQKHGGYRLYGRRDCTDCRQKDHCTKGKGRRVKIPCASAKATVSPASEAKSTGQTEAGHPPEAESGRPIELLRAHDARMDEEGDKLIKLRGHISESANAHLKQHGLARFHVHGLARCGVVLTLSCIAHNLRKWAKAVATKRLLMAS